MILVSTLFYVGYLKCVGALYIIYGDERAKICFDKCIL